MAHAMSKRFVTGITASIVAVSLATTGFVNAQQASKITLSYTPQVIEISANPGDPPIENVVRITNGSEVPVEITSKAVNFTAAGEEGEPELTEESTSFSLAQWVSITPEAYGLAPKESQDFKVTVTVPADAEPGGHFGAVQFKGLPPKDPSGNTQIGQEFNVAPLILVSVAGDIKEEANIETFKAAKSFWTNWTDDDPIMLETRIKNSGNVHFKPRGTVTIKNMFGKEVTKIPLTESNVLPDSIRKIETIWKDPGFAVGRYSAEVSFVYGADDTILTAQTNFIVFPYKTVLPALAGTFVGLFILIKFRKRFALAAKVLSGKG